MAVPGKILAVCGLVAVVAGCGAITREVVLRNDNRPAQAIPVPDSTKVIYFGGLEDRRTEREVGFEHNKTDKYSARVVAMNDVGKWVNREIVSQLRERGISFLPLDAPEEMRRVIVTGSILKVFETLQGEYQAEVCLKAKIAVNGTTVSFKKYNGKMTQLMEADPSAEMFDKTMRKALASAVMQLVYEVDVCCSRIDGNEPVETIASEGDDEGSLFEQELCPRKGNTLMMLQGTRSAYSIKSRLDSIKADVTWLYRKRQQENPSVQQSVCFGIAIGTDGRVSSVKELASSGDDELSRRLMEKIRSMRFGGRSSDSLETHVVYSMDFGQQKTQPGDNQSAATAIRVVFSVLSLIISLFLIPSMTRY